jgi:hypothetical protein
VCADFHDGPEHQLQYDARNIGARPQSLVLRFSLGPEQAARSTTGRAGSIRRSADFTKRARRINAATAGAIDGRETLRLGLGKPPGNAQTLFLALSYRFARDSTALNEIAALFPFVGQSKNEAELVEAPDPLFVFAVWVMTELLIDAAAELRGDGALIAKQVNREELRVCRLNLRSMKPFAQRPGIIIGRQF